MAGGRLGAQLKLGVNKTMISSARQLSRSLVWFGGREGPDSWAQLLEVGGSGPTQSLDVPPTFYIVFDE